MQAFSSAVTNHMRLHVLPTKQFKTFSLAMYIGIPLHQDTVTSTALIPYVWRRGNARYPETKRFRERLDDLYGAGFGFDVMKRGNFQIIVLRMDVVGDAFVHGATEHLLREALMFLADTICRPALENNIFKDTYVTAEKETLRKRIEAIVNNKIQYAAERCIAEMCKDEPYRLLPLGKIEDLPGITAESLHTAYVNLLQNASMDLYVVGDTSEEEVRQIVEQTFVLNRMETVSYDRRPSLRQPVREQQVVEEMDVKQGKLNIGLRSSVTYGDDDYPVALVYNGLLGGYPHSKLFIHVRERESLAYYASSRYDGHKGIVMIQTGIEIANKDKAEAIIRQQLEDLRRGSVTEDELNKTKAMIVNTLNEMNDSAFEQIGYHYNSVLSGKARSKQQLIDAVDATNLEAVTKVAGQIELDTIYFLRDHRGGEA